MYFIFIQNCQCFPEWLDNLKILPAIRIPFAIHLHQLLTLSIFNYFSEFVQISQSILNCISLMISKVEYFYVLLGHSCISLFEVPVQNYLLCFQFNLLIIKIFFQIKSVCSILVKFMCCKYFFLVCVLHLYFLMVSFKELKF